MRTLTLAAAIVIALLTAPAYADVEAAGQSGFALRYTLETPLAPAKAYAKFVDVKSWWSPELTLSGAAKNLKLDTKPGGCLCEKLSGGGFARHFLIARAAPGQSLVLTDGIDPVAGPGAEGVLSVEFRANGQGTTVTARYIAFGYAVNGWGGFAPQADRAMRALFERFTTFAAGGKL
jgi:hypothetical protein